MAETGKKSLSHRLAKTQRCDNRTLFAGLWEKPDSTTYHFSFDAAVPILEIYSKETLAKTKHDICERLETAEISTSRGWLNKL